MRKRGLGQDILPSPVQPKRTESLYVSPQKTPITRVSLSIFKIWLIYTHLQKQNKAAVKATAFKLLFQHFVVLLL